MISTSERRLIFVDADVLAFPRSRSLVLFGSRYPGINFAPRWSLKAEAKADAALAKQWETKVSRHDMGRRRRPVPVSVLREDPSAADWAEHVIVADATIDAMADLVDTSPGDKHIMAAARACGAGVIVSQNVPDFGKKDLARCDVSVAHPDLFLAETLTGPAYVAALVAIGEHMSKPKTPAEIHADLGRTHPRLVAAMEKMFPDVTPAAPENVPHEVFRGRRCLVCGRVMSDPESLALGVGPECRQQGVAVRMDDHIGSS